MICLIVGLLVPAPTAVASAEPTTYAYVGKLVRGSSPGEIWFHRLPVKAEGISGQVVIRNGDGEVVRVQVAQFRSPEGEFKASWSGTDAEGVRLPNGAYTAVAQTTDAQGVVIESRELEFDLQELRTVHTISKLTRLPPPTKPWHVGECARVTRLENHTVELRAGETCPVDGDIDYTFLTYPTTPAPQFFSRMIRSRIEVYGAGVPTTSQMAVAFRFSTASENHFFSVGRALTGTTGWHYSDWALPQPRHATNPRPWVKLSLRDTDGFDVKYVRIRNTFRAWVTPPN